MGDAESYPSLVMSHRWRGADEEIQILLEQ